MVKLPRNAQFWLPSYLRSAASRWRRPGAAGTVDVLFCVADHYEPDFGGVSLEQEARRVRRWIDGFPKLAAGLSDADGRPPQHTFFFPAEVYRAAHLDALADLCQDGYGEVEVHLHHGHDTSANVRRVLSEFRDTLAERHGLLSRDRSGAVRYGFIHGDWALDNGGVDDSCCGVNDELTILRETGCYADFTMPAAPDPAQSRIVNSIYYCTDDPERPRSYDTGSPAAARRPPPRDALLLIQGPLALNWRRRTFGVLPTLENGALDHSSGHHPTKARFERWVDAAIAIEGRPEWVFVKVYAHGAKEENAEVMLGPAMRRFHEDLCSHFNDGKRFRLHYVTAREMYNIVKAAEAGECGNAGVFRDYELLPVWRERTNRPARQVVQSSC
jgi:hypothetical protein